MNDYWRFRGLFAEAMDHRLFTIDHLDGLLNRGEAHFFSTDGAAIVTEFKTYPTGLRAVAGQIAAGDLDQIERVLIPRAEAWGRMNGCTLATIESRPAWQRRLKQYGFEPHQVSLVKEI